MEVEALDTSKPVDISEDEELERISGLLQRDSLVRSLGVVEQVHRLLHCTPGTTGITKNVLPQVRKNNKGLSNYVAIATLLQFIVLLI